MSVRVGLLLFARLREVAGEGRLDLEIEGRATPEACFAELVRQHPGVASLRERLMVAVNERYAGWDAELHDGDEVALIPPVSGG